MKANELRRCELRETYHYQVRQYYWHLRHESNIRKWYKETERRWSVQCVGLNQKFEINWSGERNLKQLQIQQVFDGVTCIFFLLNSSNLPWFDRPVWCSKPCSLLEKVPVMSFLSLVVSACHASLSWLLSAHARGFIANHIYLESFWIAGLVSCQVHPKGRSVLYANTQVRTWEIGRVFLKLFCYK